MSRPAVQVPAPKSSSRLIWATRGKSWGFRFIRNGGFGDPLPIYEAAFLGLNNTSSAWQRLADRPGPVRLELTGAVALRFLDPDGRRDRAGRIIPHDFVVFPPLADEIHSLEDGSRLVWPLVAGEFTHTWELTSPPADSQRPPYRSFDSFTDSPPER